jgi:hypothetical protein
MVQHLKHLPFWRGPCDTSYAAAKVFYHAEFQLLPANGRLQQVLAAFTSTARCWRRCIRAPGRTPRLWRRRSLPGGRATMLLIRSQGAHPTAAPPLVSHWSRDDTVHDAQCNACLLALRGRAGGALRTAGLARLGVLAPLRPSLLLLTAFSGMDAGRSTAWLIPRTAPLTPGHLVARIVRTCALAAFQSMSADYAALGVCGSRGSRAGHARVALGVCLWRRACSSRHRPAPARLALRAGAEGQSTTIFSTLTICPVPLPKVVRAPSSGGTSATDRSTTCASSAYWQPRTRRGRTRARR